MSSYGTSNEARQIRLVKNVVALDLLLQLSYLDEGSMLLIQRTIISSVDSLQVIEAPVRMEGFDVSLFVLEGAWIPGTGEPSRVTVLVYL